MHMHAPDIILGFVVPGRPVGKARARVTKNGTFTPAATKAYQHRVKWLFTKAAKDFRFNPDHAVELFITVRIVPPTKWAKGKRQAAKDGKILPHGKPDIDNIAKSVMDALNGLAYQDDDAVFSLNIRKVYGPADEVNIGIRYYAHGIHPAAPKEDADLMAMALEAAKNDDTALEFERTYAPVHHR